MIDYDRPVEASPEVLAELWRRFDDDLDSRGLAAYARELGVEPPAEPEGYRGWEIVEAYPNDDFEHGVLYWLGPQEDHGEEDYPTEETAQEGSQSPNREDTSGDPWA